mmetsp:Transcript_3378/g.6948  ORF Transcript_3378/g.6948 Transcript_3378/m.6948 type:complete len:126 (+) Transcript_3378:2774-3151(+)
MSIKFGLGFDNPTVTSYLEPAVMPAIEQAITELLGYLRDSGELEKWREKKDAAYIEARKEAVRKAREESGMSVEEGEEWTGSEYEESEPEQKVEETPFDSIGFLIESLKSQLSQKGSASEQSKSG